MDAIPDSPSEKNIEPGTDALVGTLYDELHVIARREHFRAGLPQTLQTTAVIHEAYLRLHRREGWNDKGHFLACAATAMRHVLIDGARARMSGKRDAALVPIHDNEAEVEREDRELLRLGDALVALALVDDQLAKLVDCRFFAGYDEQETAQILGISDRTVRRRWRQARAWIYREMTAA